VEIDKLRNDEKEFVTEQDGDFVACFDLRRNTKLQAGLSIGTTFFVCFVLAAGALVFSN